MPVVLSLTSALERQGKALALLDLLIPARQGAGLASIGHVTVDTLGGGGAALYIRPSEKRGGFHAAIGSSDKLLIRTRSASVREYLR